VARQSDVIEPRAYESRTTYSNWLRKIGGHTYRFKVMTRTGPDPKWEVRVDRSFSGGPGKRGWETVHNWASDFEEWENA
jgi:hypothetical protein